MKTSEIKIRAKWYWPFTSRQRQFQRTYHRCLPHICRALDLPFPLPFPIYIKRHGLIGVNGSLFNTAPVFINISCEQVLTVMQEHPYFETLEKAAKAQHSIPKIDWDIFVLAHELAHYKQFREGRLRPINENITLFEGEFVNPRSYSTHFEVPYEREANQLALAVIIKLHHEGVLSA